MPLCTSCGARLHRRRRSRFLDRLRYRSIYMCIRCGERQAVARRWRPHGVLQTNCPRCGGSRVTRRRKLDKIDRVHRGPWSLLQRLLGAPIYHCRACRLQYFDFRDTASECQTGAR